MQYNEINPLQFSIDNQNYNTFPPFQPSPPIGVSNTHANLQYSRSLDINMYTPLPRTTAKQLAVNQVRRGSFYSAHKPRSSQNQQAIHFPSINKAPPIHKAPPIRKAPPIKSTKMMSLDDFIYYEFDAYL